MAVKGSWGDQPAEAQLFFDVARTALTGTLVGNHQARHATPHHAHSAARSTAQHAAHSKLHSTTDAAQRTASSKQHAAHSTARAGALTLVGPRQAGTAGPPIDPGNVASMFDAARASVRWAPSD